MKKIISLAVMGVILLSTVAFTGAVCADETPISVLLNKEQITFEL